MKPSPPILYRYSKRPFLDDSLERGCFRFSHARLFRDSTLASSQKDDEQRRYFSPDPKRHQLAVSQPDGSNAPLNNVFNMNITLNLVGRSGRPLDYFILCFALEPSDRFYDKEFEANACLIINNPEQLASRLETVCRDKYCGCDFYGRDCFYFDPSALPPSIQQKDLVFGKNAEYSWQNEFRLIFAIDPELSDKDFVEFEIGSIRDIAEFHETT